jgi:hypothetical protein
MDALSDTWRSDPEHDVFADIGPTIRELGLKKS